MKLLKEVLKGVEDNLTGEDYSNVVELNNLSEEDANLLMKGLAIYNVRKIAIVSRKNSSVNYTLHISRKENDKTR